MRHGASELRGALEPQFCDWLFEGFSGEFIVMTAGEPQARELAGEFLSDGYRVWVSFGEEFTCVRVELPQMRQNRPPKITRELKTR